MTPPALLLAVALPLTMVAPQGQSSPDIEAFVSDVNDALRSGGREAAITALRQGRPRALKYIAFSMTMGPQLQVLEAGRTDKQTGADTSATGSTSLVSKGSVPAIIGFAVENGGLTQSVSGTSITVRGNPYGLVQMVRGQLEDAIGAPVITAPASYLRRFSFSVGFDASRGLEEGADPVLTGESKQISSYSFRFEPFNERAPWTGAFQTRFADGIEEAVVTDVARRNRIRNNLSRTWFTNTVMLNWARATVDWVGDELTAQELLAALDDLRREVMRDLDAAEVAELRSALAELVEVHQAILASRQNVLDVLAKGGIIALEYTNDRPVGLPSVHVAKVIAETNLGGGFDLTFNADVRYWDTTEPFTARGVAIESLRDWSLAAEITKPVGAIEKGRPLILSAAIRGGRVRSLVMEEEAMMDEMMPAMAMSMDPIDDGFTRAALVMPADTSSWIGQVKLTLPVKEAGVRIPLSISWANRPELLTDEKEVRGSIGFTFDLEALMGGAFGF